MFKYVFMIGFMLPAYASAADYIENTAVDRGRQNCRYDQSGNRYCVELPVEKLMADCAPGVDCHHMQSGQHYSVQSPLQADN